VGVATLQDLKATSWGGRAHGPAMIPALKRLSYTDWHATLTRPKNIDVSIVPWVVVSTIAPAVCRWTVY
jgi:hypothetical protein